MHTTVECSEGVIVNKYGAVDFNIVIQMKKDIDILKGRCLHLENIIAKMAGVEFPEGPIHGFTNIVEFEEGRKAKVRQLPEDIKKMKELTKCDDYEYQTTPAKTILVKKKGE
jgi:hypothetical protein